MRLTPGEICDVGPGERTPKKVRGSENPTGGSYPASP